MIIAGIDLETGGQANCKPQENFITELGIALYDTDIGNTPVRIFNSLVKNERRIDPEMSEYTGITDTHCDKYGVDALRVGQASLQLLNSADIIVAHNGMRFDFPVLYWWLDNILGPTTFGTGKIMCDTMIDIAWPKSIKQKNLTYLAGAHEMYNPFPHRAITDVLTMMKIFFKYPIDPIIESAITPFVRVQANVSYHDKDLAKARGFWFDSETKSWFKEMRQFQLERESKDYEFKYTIVPIPE